MHTLPDPRHETFASLRASGHDVASAYVHAGYSVKNIKQRSRKLLQNPAIQARINHLRGCLPRIAELHDHHCPSLLLMPETRHEMLVWLWQVMNGTREVRPAQMRAATLYCRMRGWHLGKGLPSAESPAPADITPAEQALLAMASRENIAHERTGTPRSPESLTRFQTLMADHALPSLRQDTLGRPIPTPIPTPTPAPEAILTPLAAHASPHESRNQNPPPVYPAHSAILSKIPLPESESASHSFPPSLFLHQSSPLESPTKSPPQPAVSQHLNLLPSPSPQPFPSPHIVTALPSAKIPRSVPAITRPRRRHLATHSI
ncbi:hypothetical protein GCM10023213_21730 [Prosthecobacter algae]|uniref:Uncharacterized protein n=1 Tax=Prosthecobacter algae TaxID=1144682 RepID=A0ABP9P335_9BACT